MPTLTTNPNDHEEVCYRRGVANPIEPTWEQVKMATSTLVQMAHQKVKIATNQKLKRHMKKYN